MMVDANSVYVVGRSELYHQCPVKVVRICIYICVCACVLFNIWKGNGRVCDFAESQYLFKFIYTHVCDKKKHGCNHKKNT